MRLTYKLEEPIITTYLHFDYMRIADYDIKRGNYGKITQDEIYNKLGQFEDIEEKLGFSLNELVQMLIGGIWEVGAVDRETMLPVSQSITHFYIYGVDFKNKKIKVFHKVYKETLFDELELDKYKKKCLSGWALTKEELEK